MSSENLVFAYALPIACFLVLQNERDAERQEGLTGSFERMRQLAPSGTGTRGEVNRGRRRLRERLIIRNAFCKIQKMEIVPRTFTPGRPLAVPGVCATKI
jgi:hypothetical protein